MCLCVSLSLCFVLGKRYCPSQNDPESLQLDGIGMHLTECQQSVLNDLSQPSADEVTMGKGTFFMHN